MRNIVAHTKGVAVAEWSKALLKREKMNEKPKKIPHTTSREFTIDEYVNTSKY